MNSIKYIFPTINGIKNISNKNIYNKDTYYKTERYSASRQINTWLIKTDKNKVNK
jgi:hypothetical protein